MQDIAHEVIHVRPGNPAGAEADLDLPRWSVRWNNQGERFDVGLEAGLSERRLLNQSGLALLQRSSAAGIACRPLNVLPRVATYVRAGPLGISRSRLPLRLHRGPTSAMVSSNPLVRSTWRTLVPTA